MCGRFVQVWDAQLGRFVQVYVPTWKEEETILKDLQAQMGKGLGYNVAPSRHVGTLVAEGEGAARLEVARWGFRMTFQAPSGMPVEKEIFNTRIEEAFEKPLWRGLVGKSHAIVPVQGFYEWTGPASDREPHFIQRADGRPMLLAAVTGLSRMEEPREPCVSIVTSAANDFMRPIHDRMPVLVEEGQVADWLHPAILGTEGVLEMAQPSRAALKSHAVSKEVNNVANQGPALLAPARTQQSRLF